MADVCGKMEGACGKILESENLSVVIKKVHRRRRAQQRTRSHRAPEQCRLQSLSARLTEHMKLLYVPKAWDPEEHQYKMERIDVSKPLIDFPQHKIFLELKEFYELCKKQKIFPCDYELYEQPDGRVAMIDFDKFGTWKEDESVEFPWGLVRSKEEIEKFLLSELGGK